MVNFNLYYLITVTHHLVCKNLYLKAIKWNEAAELIFKDNLALVDFDKINKDMDEMLDLVWGQCLAKSKTLFDEVNEKVSELSA